MKSATIAIGSAVVNVNTTRMIWAAAGVALVVRCLVFSVAVSHGESRLTRPDSLSYIRIAEGIGRGALADPLGRMRPPGYPLFIASVTREGASPSTVIRAVVLAQILVNALTIVLAARVAATLAGPIAAMATAVLLAIEPSMIAFSNLVLSETIYTFALTISVWAWAGWVSSGTIPYLLTSATAVGALGLVRGIGTYLPPVFVTFAWLSRRPWRTSVLVCCVAGVLLAPAAWMIRNSFVRPDARVSNDGALEQALFGRELEDAMGIPKPIGKDPQPWERDFVRRSGRPQAEAKDEQRRYFRRVVGAYPWTAVRMVARTATLTAGVPDAELPALVLVTAPEIEGGSIRKRLMWLIELGPLGLFLMVGVFTSLGGLLSMAILWWTERLGVESRAVFGFCVAVVFYHLLLGGMASAQAARYRVPVIPVLAILLCSTMTLVYDMASQGLQARWRQK